MSLTRFALVKTDSVRLYKHPIPFALVKKNIRASTSFLHVLLWSKRTLQAFTSPYTFCVPQHGLCELLQTSYALCCDQNGLSKPPTHFAVVKTVSPNFKPSTRFADVKMDSLAFYTLCCVTTDSVVVNTDSPYLLHVLRWSRRTVGAPTSLLHALCGQDGLSKHLQASYMLWGGQD